MSGTPLNPLLPEECYEQSIFGIGPFGVSPCPPHPVNAGYGSIFLDSILNNALGYGHFPYGSTEYLASPEVTTEAGYGGDPYGFGPYGTIDLSLLSPPQIMGAISLNGFQIEILFSNAMLINSNLLDTLNYTLNSVLGAAPANISSVVVGMQDNLGATSVIITHTGSTLGGRYEISAINIVRAFDNVAIIPTSVPFYALGSIPNYTITSISGDIVEVEFDQDMMLEVDYSGIEDSEGYAIINGDYPIPITINSASQIDSRKVQLNVEGQTELTYVTSISPSYALKYIGEYGVPTGSTQNPNTDFPPFLAIPVGFGSSSTYLNNLSERVLSLNNTPGSSYGWHFQDLSGKLKPDSTFKIDISLDFFQIDVTPSITDGIFCAFFISDRDIQLSIYFERVSGLDRITFESGTFSQYIGYTWSSFQDLKLSIIRNQLAEIYTLLVDDTPLLSGEFTDFDDPATIPVGIQILLSSTYTVKDFGLKEIQITSSQTIFSQSWNFLHNISSSLIGNSYPNFTNNKILTQNGPLVKNWGDFTPATKQDVKVYINNTLVEVLDVNPYIGEITTVVPIPFTTIGTNTVEIDYYWMDKPLFVFEGLNKPGIILNKWDSSFGRVSSSQGTWVGGFDPSKFNYSLVLNTAKRNKPLLTGHKFIAYDSEYTSGINQPNKLLLNRTPHRVSIKDFEKDQFSFSSNYEGTNNPISENWNLFGQDSGGVIPFSGLYNVVDSSQGNIDTGNAAMYYQDIDTTLPSTINIGARLIVNDFTPDGVFSGVSLGFHYNRRFFILGLLYINDVYHVGMLSDINNPHLAESWKLGPTIKSHLISQDTFEINTSLVPVSLETGNRVQVFKGGQIGVYTIEDIIPMSTGKTNIVVTPNFPANIEFWGNDYADMVFEVEWKKAPTIFRMVSDIETGIAEVYVSGEIGSSVAVFTKIDSKTLPGDSNLVLDTSKTGQVFWGSISREAKNSSNWSFFRYGLLPKSLQYHRRDIIVSSDLISDLPQNDSNTEWYLSSGFGESYLNNGTCVKSSVSDPYFDFSYGFSRTENFFVPEYSFDSEFEFQLLEGTLGYEDCSIILQNTRKICLFATLRYYDDGVIRKILSLPEINLSGNREPEIQNWSVIGDSNFYNIGKNLFLSSNDDSSYEINKELDLTDLLFTDTGERICEFKIKFKDCQDASYSNGASITFGIIHNSITSVLDLNFYNLNKIGIFGNTYIVNFDWNDSEEHTYKVITNNNANAFTLLIDNTVVLVNTIIDTAQENGKTLKIKVPEQGYFFEIVYLNYCVKEPNIPELKRTVGVWNGSEDKMLLTSWFLPDSDIDWTTSQKFRIQWDKNWGLIIQKTDLPPPITYDNEFYTDSSQPSIGIISIENANIPNLKTSFGKVSFGALNKKSISLQKWSSIQYRIYEANTDKYINDPNMVLNRANVSTSGELLRDKTPEIVLVRPDSLNKINLRRSNISANLVYKIVEEDNTVIGYSDILFDRKSQMISLKKDLKTINQKVSIVFTPGTPVTETYLKNQPIEESEHLLNDLTPPFFLDQQGGFNREEKYGTTLNSSYDSDIYQNDNLKYVEFEISDTSEFHCLKYIRQEKGIFGLLSPYCDKGITEIELDGLDFTENFNFNNSVNTESINNFIFSGGGFIGSVIGNFDPLLGSGSFIGGVLFQGNSIYIDIILNSVTVDAILGTDVDLTEDFSIADTSDNVPPSYPYSPEIGSISVDGTPGTYNNGACLAVLEETLDGPSIIAGSISEDLITPNSLLYGESTEQLLGVPSSGQGFTFIGGVLVNINVTTTVYNLESSN